ncbi:hypothetical protein ACQP00_35690 [Dactylosporangium sp. CS-047395]|uniref:hypothetical protein n=1 Tax=Dactylosporangium sp. CS-047395 TaxID=3239936 RepID=UPI003D901B39
MGAHEYLQWLVDLGAVGLLGLLALIAALVVLMRRGDVGNPLWAGAVAAIAALAVHSAFDFLWELAVVPLLVGALTGMAAQPRSEEPATSITQKVKVPVTVNGGGAPFKKGDAYAVGNANIYGFDYIQLSTGRVIVNVES